MLRAVALAIAFLALAPAHALAGTFTKTGTTILYAGDAGEDKISAVQTGTTMRFTRFGAAAIGPGPGCTITPDGQTVVCQAADVRVSCSSSAPATTWRRSARRSRSR